ncbi:class I SAM-dependent RNA methyltransferase [Frigoribacterium sp. Leaf44]|uniref:class I SAM-dependent RNA methyltransferase n=1 Tax=Frigoribacterium sp. Leaf44 TaxID=1736220 RepID=UPI0006FF2B66|nr:TRAM domain-containing protein [Frigoribacterium sp. Leaf44]KQN45444.1 23S rRNA methyltransferase [Frigoribacterium sp. Leaf44]
MGDMLGREVELDVTGIAHGGISVARLDGRVVFVTDTLPGEKVVARIADDRKKAFWRADTVRVLEASEHRRPHVWGAAALEVDPADRAGGAEFGHIELAHQRELKRRVVVDALTRMGGVADADGRVSVEALPGDDDRGGTGWRTRLRLHLDAEGRPGQYAARSHRVVHVPDLPLASPEVAEVAPLGDAFPGEEHVDVVAPSVGGARLIIGRQARSTITEVVGDREFRLDDGGFWQVHREAAATLTAAVQTMIDPERFDPKGANLDLYGGVGLLAAAVGDRFGAGTRITSVESDERATEHASENLAEWIGASAVTGRVERWLRQTASQAGDAERERLAAATVVLDPPRSGAGRDVVSEIAALRPAQVVYVACDPVALARDVALFAERGYELDALQAYDLFPNTHHVETVVSLLPA